MPSNVSSWKATSRSAAPGARKDELARMLGGQATSKARAHAAELLAEAARPRKASAARDDAMCSAPSKSTRLLGSDIVEMTLMHMLGRALLVAVVVRVLPCGARGDAAADARADRGLVEVEVPDVAPLARTTRPMDYAQKHYARRIAVTIGISAYAERSWPRLPAAARDAQRMATLFRAMGFDRIETLQDETATRDGILDLLERRLPLIAGERDLVVVFFAGHGATAGGQGYIIPRDAARDLERSAISVQRLKESVLRMRVRHTVFLLDACFSGVMLRRADLETANSLAYWEAAAHDRVVQIVTAGRADELAQESNGWGHFTRALHAGLAGAADRNRDGVVTTEELGVYAAAHVQREGHGRQHPQWGTMEGSGTAVFLDARRLPSTTRPAASPTRPMIAGLEASIGRIHQLMARHQWAQAEKELRSLLIEHSEAELRLLLAEVYVESDTLGNARLIDTELQRAEDDKLTVEQQRRLLDLRERLDRARRGPM